MDRLQISVAVVTVSMIIVMGAWAIDSAVSAMRANTDLDNPFFRRSPSLHYHLGLMAVLAGAFTLAILSLLAAFKKPEGWKT